MEREIDRDMLKFTFKMLPSQKSRHKIFLKSLSGSNWATPPPCETTPTPRSRPHSTTARPPDSTGSTTCPPPQTWKTTTAWTSWVSSAADPPMVSGETSLHEHVQKTSLAGLIFHRAIFDCDELIFLIFSFSFLPSHATVCI